MTTREFRPEVEERLLHLDPAVHQPEAEPIEHLISACLREDRNEENRDLARRVIANHREFFDLIGER